MFDYSCKFAWEDDPNDITEEKKMECGVDDIAWVDVDAKLRFRWPKCGKQEKRFYLLEFHY